MSGPQQSHQTHPKKQVPHYRRSAATITSAEDVARGLGGRKIGRGWAASCPAHDDRTPSLSIDEGVGGRVLVYCHAGCSQEEVIAALRSRGLWGRTSIEAIRGAASVEARGYTPDDGANRINAALAIWQSANCAEGTLVQNYLGTRKIKLLPLDVLRFHEGLRHPSGDIWPAMAGLVSRGVDGAPLGIHRTFLAYDGGGKAPVSPQKMMLGPCRGGVVRLADPSDVLMVGEGIETCLAAMQVTGNPAWAALSTSGMRALELPTNVRDVIVLADGDDAGESAACDCAWRWKGEGRRVRIARPPRGFDFNDLLLGRVSHVMGGF